MDDSEASSLEQMRAFLLGSGEVRFSGVRRAEVYAWVEATLVRHEYAGLKRGDKGVVRRYVGRMVGLSRAQVARLIACHRRTGHVRAVVYQRTKFVTRYTAADVVLLAYVDKAHGNLCGQATKRILEREHATYGQAAYERLSKISVAQLYRLRNSAAYRLANTTYEPTRPTVNRIGERRKPQPRGAPGYLRIDTVHQGDFDGLKGIYHINIVDEVTQWDMIAATPRISEFYLIPLLETMLGQFPFVIRGFHSDNGSEFINHTVAKLLDKLMVEQTKSRAGRSGDNGLVEAKNAAIIRKHIGFAHIGPQHAEAVDAFHRDVLNPYVNFHRPCARPTVLTEPNGKRCRIYRNWDTPFDLLKQVPHWESFLRPGVTLASLDAFSMRQSDTEAALDMQQAKRRLMARIAKLSA
jgi:transposase InsO family protein